jgi:hypothetical protein
VPLGLLADFISHPYLSIVSSYTLPWWSKNGSVSSCPSKGAVWPHRASLLF